MPDATEDRKATEAEVEGPIEITSDEGKQRFGQYLGRAGFGNERIVVTRFGKPFAAIIGMRDLAALEATAA
jgi:prevent-host-death family protein